MAKAKYRLIKRDSGEFFAQKLMGDKWLFYLSLDDATTEDEAEKILQEHIRRNNVKVIAEYDATGLRISRANRT